MSERVSREPSTGLVAGLIGRTRLAALRHRHRPDDDQEGGIGTLAREATGGVAAALAALPPPEQLPAALRVIEQLWREDLRLLRDYGGLNGGTGPRLAPGDDFV